MGPKLAENILAAIEKSRMTTLDRLLYALGIRQVGESLAKLLAREFGSLEELAGTSEERLESIPGVGPQKAGSIGRALSGTEIKIVDEDGRELPRGEVGELIVKGDNVMQGYYQDKAATASVIKNGWLYTGDLGRMDDDDYIFLTGLKKRMIITSGFNVYPKEVEDVLYMNPAVQAVRVVGKKDLMRGEIVKAEIVKNDGSMIDEKEILKYCRIYLSPYKVPREVEFVRKLDI
jgi:long-chain acyl-CoA synthetase